VVLLGGGQVQLGAPSPLRAAHHHGGALVRILRVGVWRRRVAVHQDARKTAPAGVVGQVAVVGVGRPPARDLLQLTPPEEEEADDDEEDHAQQRDHHVEGVCCALRGTLTVAAHCVHAAGLPELHLGGGETCPLILNISPSLIHAVEFRKRREMLTVLSLFSNTSLASSKLQLSSPHSRSMSPCQNSSRKPLARGKRLRIE